LHKVNTTNTVRPEFHSQVVNRYVQGSTRVVNETREVRGVNCNCYGVGGGSYRSTRFSGGFEEGGAVSYRD
jgi:hypothetical protein